MSIGPNNYAQHAANAFNRRDVEAMLALVSEDFTYLDGTGIQVGREAMRQREIALFEAFPDAHVILSPFAVGVDRLALTAMLSGTFAAPLVLPGRVIPPMGALLPCTTPRTSPSRTAWPSMKRCSSTVRCYCHQPNRARVEPCVMHS